MKRIGVFLVLMVFLLGGCAVKDVSVPSPAVADEAPVAKKKMRGETIKIPDEDGNPMLYFIIGYDENDNPRAFFILDKDKKTVINVAIPEG